MSKPTVRMLNPRQPNSEVAIDFSEGVVLVLMQEEAKEVWRGLIATFAEIELKRREKL